MNRNWLSFGLGFPLMLTGCAAAAPAASVPQDLPTQVAVVEPTPIPQPTAVVAPATATAVVVPATPTALPPTEAPTAVVEPTATADAANCPPPPGPGKKPPPGGKKPPAGCPAPPGAEAPGAGTSNTGSGSGTSSSGTAATTTTTSGPTAPAPAISATTTTAAAAKSYGTVNGDWRYISGNGIPSHNYADPRGEVQGQNFTFSLPANPVKGSSAISLPTRNPNLIGTSISGIPIFSAVNAAGTDIYTAGEKFDNCYGHPNKDGWYHYHVFGSCVTGSTTALWAYALDGFPIYGPTDSGSASEPADLDACRGHEHGNLGYHYHTKDPSRMDGSYVIACFMGSKLGSWSNGSTSGP